MAVEGMRPHAPCADDTTPSVGEGMIPTESRMREDPHVRFDERGLETWLGSRSAARSESDGIADPTVGAPALDSTGIWTADSLPADARDLPCNTQEVAVEARSST